jgi:Tol biopolymer transport system component
MLSSDGRDLAFLRNDRGRGQMILRRAFQVSTTETPLSPPRLNVYEASFLSDHKYAFSADENGSSPKIFLTDGKHSNAPIVIAGSRYPALSPDGRWMVYSRLDHGVWNLWLRDEDSGLPRRIADVPCNQIQPSWESDSKTLLYGTDCGRSVWFTAIARRRVLP